MALGDKNNKEYYENTYYSRVRFRNSDNITLGFSFWKGLLKISLSQVKTGSNEYEEIACIHLSPMKAKLLKADLEYLKTLGHDDTRLFGVDTGSTDTRNIIAFGNDITSTKDGIKRYLVIGKVDPNGTLLNPVRFDFNFDYNITIEWFDLEKMDCGKRFDNNLEIDMIITTLEQFTNAMTGAVAYSVMDMGRFDYSRITTKIESIMTALNIDTGRNNGGDQSNSYFNRNGAASPQNSNRGRSSSMTIEDLDNM